MCVCTMCVCVCVVPEKHIAYIVQIYIAPCFSHSHRNIQVRRAAAQFLGQTVECCGSAQLLHGSRDLAEKTLVATLNFISDAAAEPR